MDTAILNRLVAARDLLESSGPSLGTYATASLVGRKLLAAHDAAELVFLALSAIPGAAPVDANGKIVRDPPFIRLAAAVLDFADEHYSLRGDDYLRVFEDLLEARKLFKHSGMLVDPISNAFLFSRSVEILEALCTTLVGQSLVNIDLVAAIHSGDIRAKFNDARRALSEENYKLSLECTAQALAEALWRPLSPLRPTVGEPSAETALLLAGKGIDPASFLAMQQFLPLTHYLVNEPRWTLRSFGHPENWTYESADFCLRTAVETTVKLQHSGTHPFARDFYECFTDIVEVTHEEPEVYLVRTGVFSIPGNYKKLDGLQIGDRILGRARAHIERFSEHTENLDESLAYTEWVSIEDPVTDRIDLEPPSFFQRNTLWFRKDEISVDYQINEIWAAHRELQSPE